jgi:hypothetical protein
MARCQSLASGFARMQHVANWERLSVGVRVLGGWGRVDVGHDGFEE